MSDVKSVNFQNAKYSAQLMPVSLAAGWQDGDITSSLDEHTDLHKLAQDVLDSLVPVDTAQLPFSDCTDGRLRLQLQDANASPVPVRQKLVGNDIMTAFAAAELLGERFYKDPYAPVTERLNQVAELLLNAGLQPATHIGCGGALSFPVVMTQKLFQFAQSANFMSRQQNFVTDFDQNVWDKMIANYQKRLALAEANGGLYAAYSSDLITEVVRIAGKQKNIDPGLAIAEYRDDGRGVMGHMERLIVRIDSAVDDTLDVNELAAKNDAQVFSINDARLRKIAALFASANNEDLQMANMAVEAFTNAAHGTLASGLPTLIITNAN